MNGPVIVDAGPIVALLLRRERHHAWAHEQFRLIRPPAITCEAALSECFFLLRHVDSGADALIELLARRLVILDFSLDAELTVVTKLLKRYRAVPMSLADACLVRMAEQHADSPVLTLDHDFRIYRKNGRQTIRVIMPE